MREPGAVPDLLGNEAHSVAASSRPDAVLEVQGFVVIHQALVST